MIRKAYVEGEEGRFCEQVTQKMYSSELPEIASP